MGQTCTKTKETAEKPPLIEVRSSETRKSGNEHRKSGTEPRKSGTEPRRSGAETLKLDVASKDGQSSPQSEVNAAPPRVDWSRAGISFNYLKTLEVKHNDWTMNELCNDLIKPRSIDTSYVEYLAKSGNGQGGNAFVKAKADYFVSYCWRYKWTSLISSLQRFQDEQNGADFFVWLDAFVVNQHTSASVSQDTWIATFGESLKEIGNALIVLVGWNDLMYVTRAWCVFEVFSIVQSGIQHKILISKEEEDGLQQAMVRYAVTPEFIEKYLSNIDIARSQAARPEDKELIISTIAKLKNGLNKVNDVVLNEMKQWLLRMGKMFIQNAADPNSKEARSYYYSLYSIHSGLRDIPESLKAAEELLRVSRVSYGDVSFEVGVSLSNLATALDELNRHQESLERYEEALVVYRQVLPENHAQIGILYGNLGLTLKNMKRYDEALIRYQEALKVKSAANPQSASVATTLSTIGVLYNMMGDLDKALDSHLKALDIRLKTLGEGHVSIAVTHNNIAHIYLKQGDMEKVREHGIKSYEINKRVYGEDHPRTKETQHWTTY